MARNNDALVADAKRLRAEFVIAVLGTVVRRESANPKMSTGEIEVDAREIRLLNDAKVPPFSISNEDATIAEEMRLKYRYLDLRRPRMQHNIALRHKATMAIRKYFDENGFLEIETPMLAKSTPEGARDYLVPSRVHPGEFYALPQSPQIFKQILMISGMDRYFQIVKCFRDEDLRADRQPEFTQVDLEICFATEDLVFSTIEPLMERLMALIGREAPRPFRADAVLRRPSRRTAPTSRTSDPAWRSSTCRPRSRNPPSACSRTPSRRAARSAASSSRAARNIRARISTSSSSWRNSTAPQAWSGRGTPPARSRVQRSRRPGEATIRQALDAAGAADGDLLLLAAGAHEPTSKVLGTLRLHVARKENLLDPERFEFLWVVDFPMFEWQEGEAGAPGRYEFMHHPFTAPLESDAALLETDQGRARARAYDLVLNGSEIAGGSIRIHDQAIQRLIFKLLQISEEEAKTAFWILPRCSRIWNTAAWRDRARTRPYRGDSVRRTVDSRRHRLPQNRAGAGLNGRRAVHGGRQAAAGTEIEDNVTVLTSLDLNRS